MSQRADIVEPRQFSIPRRDWPAAWRALRALMANKDDTEQVFLLMDALNADADVRCFKRLLNTVDGGQIAYRRVELAERFMDRKWLDQFGPETVGGTYRAFLDETGYSAAGLADISQVGTEQGEMEHPYAWLGRYSRDVHDIWHILTGYKADEHLGEAALVAFSFAQLGGWGWGAIAIATWFESLSAGLRNAQASAIVEGYRNGRKAAWLLAEDYETLLGEPLEDARHRLRIASPARYLSIPPAVRAASLGRAVAVASEPPELIAA